MVRVQEGFIVVKSPRERDPDGSLLRGALELHFMIENARHARVFLVYLLGALGVPIWLTAALPARVPQSLRTPSLVAWAICLLGLLRAILSEWSLHRRRAVLLKKLGSPPPLE
jgi:hypothetical protein